MRPPASRGVRSARCQRISWYVGGLFLGWFAAVAAEAATLRIVPGPSRSGKAFVSCTFDGIKTSCFLDTGSAMTLLAGAPAFAHYPNLGNFRFQSASAIPQQAETILIRSAAVDRVHFSNLKLGRVPREEGLETTLGIDLIGRQPFAVHFVQNPSLHLNPKPPRAILPGLEVNAQRLLALPIRFGAVPVQAVWDTGAGITAVDEAFVQAHPADFTPSGREMAGTDGTGHSLMLKVFRAKKIRIGPRTFGNVKVIVLDLSVLRKQLGPNIHAVIGFNLIRRTDWFFDPQHGNWSIR